MIDDFGPYHRLTHRYHADLIALWGEANRQYQTDKAKINRLIKIIPRKHRIERFVFPTGEKENLSQTMILALREGCWVGLRSCYLYQPLGKAPWIMGMKSRKAVQCFFSPRKKGQRRVWLGTPAAYHEWLADPGLKEIVVMFNPAQLCPKYKKEHFVGRVEIFGSQLRTEIRLNTDQLRDADSSVERSDLIIATMELKDTFRFEKGPVVASFGRRYFKTKTPRPKEKTIKMLNGVFGEFRPENPAYKKVIRPSVLQLSHEIISTVLNEWCEAPFNLYYRLQALREFGLGTIEFQGRIEKNRIGWMLVYDLRGVREVAKLI